MNGANDGFGPDVERLDLKSHGREFVRIAEKQVTSILPSRFSVLPRSEAPPL
jgi:hypothetical protein